MTSQLSSKLTALAVALMMNSLLFGAVAYLFSGQAQATVMVAHAPVPTQAATA